MNLRVVVDGTSVGRGGMTTYAINILRSLQLVYPEWEFVGVLPESVASHLSRGDWTVASNSSKGKLWNQQIELRKKARSFGADVGLSLASVVPLVGRIPWVEVVHDWRHIECPDEFSLAARTYRSTLYRASLRSADRLIYVSERTKSITASVYPSVKHKKSRVIYHGSDHVEYDQSIVPQRIALAYGHWANKRPELALRVWARAGKFGMPSDWTLHVVGTSDRVKANLECLATSLSIEGRVRIHSYLPDEDFSRLQQAAGMHLITSTNEGFGLPVLEALRRGQAVIATRGVGMNEAGGQVAIYHSWEDLDDAGHEVASLVSDAARLERIATAGVRHARMFSWRASAVRYGEFLQRGE